MSKKIKITEEQLKMLVERKHSYKDDIEEETSSEVEVDEEEDCDEKKDMPTPPSEEETKNNQVYESIRASFKRFI